MGEYIETIRLKAAVVLIGELVPPVHGCAFFLPLYRLANFCSPCIEVRFSRRGTPHGM
jgi:hypothetical protein